MTHPQLTTEAVRHIAHLGRLELTDAELATMTRQLDAVLHYVEQIQQLDLAGVEPMAHALPVANVLRDDEPAPSLSVDDALSAAPAQGKNASGQRFFAVPAVLE